MTKFTIVLSRVDERVPYANLNETIQLLADLPKLPTQKYTLVLQCVDRESETLYAQIYGALRERPLGIDAVIKREETETVDRITVPTPLPMDRIAGFAESHGIDRVTLEHNGRSVDLTRETARGAAEMLRRSVEEEDV